MPLLMPFFGIPIIFFAGAVIFCILVMVGMMVLMRRMMRGCCFGCWCQNTSRDCPESSVLKER